MRTIRFAAALLACALAAETVAADQPPPMPGEPVPAKFEVGIKSGDPLANLPPNVRLISPFGERAIISPNGKKIAFMGRAFGDAFEYDIASGSVRNLTAHMPHNGWTRVHYLPDGSYILIGTRNPAKTNEETRWDRLELFWMDASGARPAVPLGEKLFEGVAMSRDSNRIAWATPTSRKGTAFQPGGEGSSTLYVGEVQPSSDGSAKIVNKRPLRTFDWKDCVIEGQDILRGDTGVVVPCYRSVNGKFDMKAVSVALADGKVTNYPVPAGQYAEVEGMFPDGKRTLVECADDNHIGLDLCILELVPNKPRYTRITRVMDYGNYRFSNGTVSPDGSMIAFQFAKATDDYGAGRGILLMTGVK